MACREPRLWYTHHREGNALLRAMACREPRLWYTLYLGPAARHKAMACREPRLWYTAKSKTVHPVVLWLAENRGFGTLREGANHQGVQLWLAENRGFGTLISSSNARPRSYGLPRTAALVHCQDARHPLLRLWLAENRGFGTLETVPSYGPCCYGLPRTAALVHSLQKEFESHKGYGLPRTAALVHSSLKPKPGSFAMACREPRLWYTQSLEPPECNALWLAENRGFGTLT